MADLPTTTQPTGESGNIIYIWKFPVDRLYVKSLTSILKIAASFLSLIAFICCASGHSDDCDNSYSSTYNYFEFVSISAFITLMIFWLLYTLTLTSRLFFKLIPWKLVDLAYLILYIILYLIADIVLAAQSCDKDNNRAGAAFGFFAMFCLCANVFFAFREWQSSRNGGTSSTAESNKTGEYNAERNLEQY